MNLLNMTLHYLNNLTPFKCHLRMTVLFLDVMHVTVSVTLTVMSSSMIDIINLPKHIGFDAGQLTEIERSFREPFKVSCWPLKAKTQKSRHRRYPTGGNGLLPSTRQCWILHVYLDVAVQIDHNIHPLGGEMVLVFVILVVTPLH